MVDTLDIDIDIKYAEISFSDEIKPSKQRFNRAKEKRQFERRVREDLEDR